MALRFASPAGVVAAPRERSSWTRGSRLVVVRAKELREYREDSDEVVVAGSEGEQSASSKKEPLYADQMPRKKDNMSKEMKARLRQEYVGFGGAENTGPLGRLPVVAAFAVLEEGEPLVAAADVASLERAAASADATTSGSDALRQARGGSKRVVDPSEQLLSTAEHRLYVFGTMGLMGASLAVAASHIGSADDVVSAAAAVLGAYVISDLLTGIYHWGVDNYGDGNTPVFGKQIAAFQGHHQRPWTITQREFCNNVHQVFKPAAAPSAVLLAASPALPVWAGFFAPTLFFLGCMSQQFHAWSHMKKSELPGYIVALQDAGLLISRKDHGAHHKPNFDGNYSIVSGMWNAPLDNSGFFRWLEQAIADRTGVEPRCWYPPVRDWAEQAQPADE